MKIIVFITCTVLTTLVCNIYGQNFETICKVQSTSWNYIPNGGCDAFYTDSITILKDTLYNSQKYYVLYNHRFLENGRVGFLREDTITGKLWYSENLQTSEEYLVMDLNLQKNDAFLIYDNNSSFEIYVDSVYYDNNNRKHIDFGYDNLFLCSANPKFEFIEGIGTSAFLFYQGTANSTQLSMALLCCNKENQQIYSNETFSNICNITEVGIVETGLVRYPEVYPNPSKFSFQVKFDNPGAEVYTLNIYSLTGQIVFTISTIGNSIIIDGACTIRGMYLYRLTSDNGKVFTGKIMTD